MRKGQQQQHRWKQQESQRRQTLDAVLWEVAKRLECCAERLEADAAQTSNAEHRTSNAQVVVIQQELAGLRETLARIETQNKGILNLLRMLFKLLREPETQMHLPTSKWQTGEGHNMTVTTKPR